MSDRVPYHELQRTVERLELSLAAVGPLAEAVVRLDARAVAADERAQDAERRVRELEREAATPASQRELAAAYRRGYSTGYQAASKGRPENPDGALSDPRCIVRAAA